MVTRHRVLARLIAFAFILTLVSVPSSFQSATAKAHKVTYALGGGTGTLPTEANHNSGDTFIVASSAGITRAGYAFNNWFDGTTGYAPGSTYTMPNVDVTLTATWTPTHSVTYALGGGTGTVPTQGVVAEGSTFVVGSSSGISRSGYTFNNWSNGISGFAPGAIYTMGTSNVTLTATWTPITHSVTYSLGGGTGTLPTQGAVAEGATFTVASSSGITRAGYIFNNWSDGTSGYAPGSTYTMGTSNVTLTATWTAITHTVIYALGGGTGTLPSQTPVAEGATFTVASSSGITRTGYTFNNWSDGTTGFAPGATYTMGTSNVTLTATWTAITRSVTYALGGGTGTVPTQAPVAEGSSFVVASSSGITRAGYTFNNWSDGTTGYAPGATYTVGASNVTLTATWTTTTHSVTYALGGGTGTVPTQGDVAEGSTFTVASSSGITRAGHTFNNWSDGTTGYAPGASYTMGTSNVTLTATWTAITRSVTYALGGGTGTVPTQAPVAEGSSFTVASSSGITRAGYTFNNWSDGTTGYAPGASYTVGASNVTLTAMWTAITHSVTYALGGGTGTVPTQSAVAEGSSFVVASSSGISRSGYTFNNWSDGATGYAPGSTYLMGTSNVTLTATWTAITHNVTYTLGGGTGTLPTQPAVAEGSTFTVASSSGITRAGYTFNNWSDGTTGYAPGATYTMGTINVTLTATWNLIPPTTHSVTYALGGGSGTLPTQTDVAEGSSFTVASSSGITRSGYTFNNWSDGTTGYAPGASYTMGTSNVTLTATWVFITVTTHTVTYALGGGSGTLPTQADVAEGANFTVASSTGITRSGYTFNNWSDGTTGYAPGASYTMGTSNVTLTAIWTAITHTVTYALGGGTGTLPTQADVAEGSTFTVASSSGITRAGYTFNNWFNGTTGYAPGATYTISASNVTLTATWTPIIHTVTYALGGGTGTVPIQADVAEGSSFVVASSSGITRAGYTFNNWSDGTTGYAPSASYTMGTNNVTLTATWILISVTTHTVTYALGGGSGTVPTQADVAEGSTFTVASSSGITRAGYTFNNWSDGSTGYAPGANYTMGTSNVTLTATWTAITRSVTYALGGGLGTLPTQAPVAEGSSFIVASSSGITRPGFTFNNWSDGTTGYAPGASYIAGSSNITLTATWTAVTRSVTYALGGGTGTVPTQAPVAQGLTFVVASSSGITRTGYTFNNWSDGTTGYAPGATYTVGSSNITLTATWSVVTRSVTYALGGGTGTVPTQAPVAEGSTFIVGSSSAITRTGFSFNNWSDGTTGYAPGATYTVGSNNITLTATWLALPSHTLTFDANGGVGTMADEISSGPAIISTNTFTRPGFTFVGWMSTPTGGIHFEIGDIYSFTSDKTLYAEWSLIPTTTVGGGGASAPAGSTPVIRNVTFDGNGATGGTMSVQSATASSDLSPNLFTRPGYKFEHWSTNAVIDGTTYNDGEIFDFKSDLTLYAHWGIKAFNTVTFESNGAIPGGSFSQNANQTTVLAANTFARKGYSFTGWATVANGAGLSFAGGATYGFDQDIILFAQWEPIVIEPIVVSAEVPLILPILANEAKTVVVGVRNAGAIIPLTLDIPVGITGFDGTIRLIPVLVTDLDPQGLISIKIEILDSFGAVIPQINALLTIRFSNAAGETVVASSPDGFIWTPIPLMESGRTTLNPGERDGYYLDSNGKVVIVTTHLTFFGFKKRQATKLALNISAPKPIKGYLAKVSSVGGSGVGFVRFLSLTTPVCSVSESGELKFNSTGPCKITAVKGGDKTHLHQDAPVYQLNVRENSVNVIGSGTTKKVVVKLGSKYAYKKAVIEYSASGSEKYLLLSSVTLSKSGQVTISKKVPAGSMLRVMVAGKVVASTLVNGKS